VWGLGYLHELTINRQDGVIIVASLLLFPSTLLVYGVASMIFAAKEAIEKRARQKGREEGRRQALKAERKRIEQELAALENSGVLIPPEIVRIITRESTPRS
jgi:hypothetical protein